MGAKAYLTIDDSPSTRMDDLVDYLLKKSIPALFFCRGDHLEKNITSAVRAVQNGFLLGNHTYSHPRASQISVDQFIDEVERTEDLIYKIYIMAGYEQTGKYFRFPHLDRGCGSAVLDFDSLDMKVKNISRTIFTEGLNHITSKAPSAQDIAKKQAIQDYLKEQGYSCPCKGVNLAWYRDTAEIQNAADCLFTFSSADWMMTMRHKGKWIYKSLEDLKAKIDHDKFLLQDGAVGTVLIHDQAEIIDSAITLIDHMLDRGLEFQDFE